MTTTVRCRNCRQSIQRGAACPQCKPASLCPRCGHRKHVNSQFCGRCVSKCRHRSVKKPRERQTLRPADLEERLRRLEARAALGLELFE